MNYSEIAAFFTALVPLQIQKVIYFCINHVHLAMIIMGLAVLLAVVMISVIKRIFFPDASIIRSAHEKRQSVAKKLLQAKEQERIGNASTHVKARRVKSGSKKFILVPYDEWQEFVAYKKNLKQSVSSKDQEPSGSSEPTPVLKLKKGYSIE